MTTNDPYSPNFSYNKYSLEQLDNWVNDALNCEDLTPQDIYDTIVKCVDDSVEYHKKYLTKSIELLSLLKGHREVDFGDEGNITLGDTSDWNDFWEENYYPEEYYKIVRPSATQRDIDQYSEEELNAMCDKAASDQEKEKCREYNLREAEYYNQRAKLDAEVSRNDPTRLKYENGWIYESPDGGKTVTKRRVGSLQKEIVKVDGYSTSERKHWTLPVEEVRDEDTGEDEYCITFPDDLLEAANLKEGDSIEWIDRGDGSYELRKYPR